MEQNENDKKTKSRTLLMTMAGEPPVGDNTTIMLYMVSQAALVQHRPVAYFSPDIPATEVVNRLIAVNTGIDPQKISDGTLTTDEWQKLDAQLPRLAGAPLYIDDTREIELFDLLDKIVRLVKEQDVEIVVVNPANCVAVADGGKRNAQQRTNFVTDNLKKISEDLGVVIFIVEE